MKGTYVIRRDGGEYLRITSCGDFVWLTPDNFDTWGECKDAATVFEGTEAAFALNLARLLSGWTEKTLELEHV